MNDQDPRKSLEAWVEMWREEVAHKGDVAYVLQQCLAKTGDASLFQSSPIAIQEELLETLRRFKDVGISEICIPHSALYKDVSAEALAAINTLVRADVLSPDAATIAQRRPFFVGAEYLVNGAALTTTIPSDPGLVSAKLVGISTPPSVPMGFPQIARLSVQFEFYEREAKDDAFFALNPTRSCVAHLETRGSMDRVFTELAASDYIASISIALAKRGRRSGFNVLVDFHATQGTLFCETISLEALEWLEVARDG